MRPKDHPPAGRSGNRPVADPTRPTGSIDLWLALLSLRPPAHLLESDTVANVVTLDEDGGPQVTAAWVGLDGERSSSPLAGPAETQEPPPRSPHRALDPVDHHERVGVARISRRVRHRARDKGVPPRPPTPRPHLSRARRRVPGDARSPAGIRHKDHSSSASAASGRGTHPQLNMVSRRLQLAIRQRAANRTFGRL